MSSQPHNTVDPLAQLRHDLRTPVNQIIGYSEMLQEDAEAGGHKAYVSDLQKIQLAARQLLELVNSKLNVETLSGVVSRSPSSHTSAHRRANQPLGDGHGETGFFARYNGQILVADDNLASRELMREVLETSGHRVAE